MYSHTDKTILVTGASSGIGRQITIACSQAGAKVIATGRNENKLQATMAELQGQGHQIISCDLTDASSRIQLVSQLPRVNGIVHCAGQGHSQACQFVTPDDISRVFDINFDAAVLLVGELMRNKKILKGSSIVFISSIAASHAWVGNAIYSASKAALISYADCLALELAPRRTRVNCICPAMVETEFIQNSFLTEEDIEADKKNYPLGRYGQPEDISGIALYLLSDDSSWVTGSHFNITGGFK
jgi:NAD(P)-dependent dehydrogenase (short-subunit alcohol dehydrogenase family)